MILNILKKTSYLGMITKLTSSMTIFAYLTSIFQKPTKTTALQTPGFEGPEPRERDALEPYLIEVPEIEPGDMQDLQKQATWD